MPTAENLAAWRRRIPNITEPEVDTLIALLREGGDWTDRLVRALRTMPPSPERTRGR